MDIKEEALNEVVGGQSGKSSTDIKCPNCGNMVHVTMEQILKAHPFTCTHCGLTWSYDPVKSKEAIAALKRMGCAPR